MTALSASDLLARQRPGYTLPQALHLDPDIYRLELERIWRPAWLFAAHSAELRRPGDRTVFDIADDSVLLVRGERRRNRSFSQRLSPPGVAAGGRQDRKFCRLRRRLRLHRRGASAALPAPYRFATAPPDPFIRCPYHQWAYRFDGSLAACGGMDRVEGFDTSEHGLLAVECVELGGLIFVRLSSARARAGSR